MDELTEFLKFLHGAGASIIPWLVLALVAWVIVSNRHEISEYLSARSSYWKSRAENDAELKEIIRNNSATIDACSEVIRMMGDDRMRDCDAIDHHDKMSVERMTRLQAGLDDGNAEIGKLRGDVGILLDRVHK